MALQAEQDLDLVKTTLNELGEFKWTDLVSTLQRYIFLSEILKKEKVGFESGTQIQWNMQITPSGAFKMTGIGASDQGNITDAMTTAVIPWRHGNTNWYVDQREIAINRKPRKIVDLVKERRANAMISMAEGLENQCWQLPGGSSNTLDSFGVPYFVVPNATQGFNGGNPFGYSAGCAGVSSTAVPAWANYTDSYSDFTKLDLVRKMRRAARFVDWESPVEARVPDYNTGNKGIIYTTLIVVQRLEEAAEQQNDNLGDDIASKDGKAVFKRNRLVWVPKLDNLSGQGMSGTFSNSTYASTGGYAVNPVFMLNTGVFRPVFLEGWYMREDGPYQLKGIQHTMLSTQIDITFNLECRDRRRQALLTQ